jgi:hypothetical protein
MASNAAADASTLCIACSSDRLVSGTRRTRAVGSHLPALTIVGALEKSLLHDGVGVTGFQQRQEIGSVLTRNTVSKSCHSSNDRNLHIDVRRFKV